MWDEFSRLSSPWRTLHNIIRGIIDFSQNSEYDETIPLATRLQKKYDERLTAEIVNEARMYDEGYALRRVYNECRMRPAKADRIILPSNNLRKNHLSLLWRFVDWIVTRVPLAGRTPASIDGTCGFIVERSWSRCPVVIHGSPLDLDPEAWWFGRVAAWLSPQDELRLFSCQHILPAVVLLTSIQELRQSQ